jgi:hypothetical protein
MLKPLRLAFAARIVTLVALLATLVVVGVRIATAGRDWVAGVVLDLDAIGGNAERGAADVYRQRSRGGNVANEPVGTNESCRSHWSSVCTDRITVKSTSTFLAQALWVADSMSIVAPVRPLCPCCRAGSRHALGLPAALYR